MVTVQEIQYRGVTSNLGRMTRIVGDDLDFGLLPDFENSLKAARAMGYVPDEDFLHYAVRRATFSGDYDDEYAGPDVNPGDEARVRREITEVLARAFILKVDGANELARVTAYAKSLLTGEQRSDEIVNAVVQMLDNTLRMVPMPKEAARKQPTAQPPKAGR